MKQAAVIALCMREGSAQSVAQELGVSRPSLYNWKNQLLSHDATASMKRQKDSPASSERAKLEQQIEGLRRDRIDMTKTFAGDEWLRLLSPAHQERVMAESYERTYAPKDVVAPMGEVSNSWVGVSEGLLKVSAVTGTGQAIMFTAVQEGSWVGEGSVIKREQRRYGVSALRESRVVHLPRSTFMWLLEESNEFSRFIIDHLNERTGQFISMLEVARISHPAARVAGALSSLFNPVLNPRARPLLNISQEELGDLAGLSRSSANQAVSALKRANLISTQYAGILVLDINGLTRFSLAAHADQI